MGARRDRFFSERFAIARLSRSKAFRQVFRFSRRTGDGSDTRQPVEIACCQKIALSGGAPVTITSIHGFIGGSWADDDMIYFVPDLPSGIACVPAAGGASKEV